MRYRCTLVMGIAVAIGLTGMVEHASAGVANIVPNQTMPTNATGVRYKIHVDDVDPVEDHKIIFGAIRFHNAGGCPAGGCRYYQLETTLNSSTLTYTDSGCLGWPEQGDVDVGASLLVNIIDYGSPRRGTVGIRQVDATTTSMFPRQNAGIDNIKGLTRITSWSQMDVTGKTIEVQLTRGGLMTVPSGASVLGWGHRFAPEPAGGYPEGPVSCVAELPSGITYRLWNLSATIDSTTYAWEVALPDADASHLRPNEMVEFGTEFFEHFETGVFSARYFDIAYESGGTWTPITQFRVNYRLQNENVCYDPNVLTVYGWGPRKKPFGSSCAVQFANDGVNNYYTLHDAFVLDAACTELPVEDPPTLEPAPPLPEGVNIALGKTSAQSSNLNNFPSASFGVDEIRNCTEGETITHTDQDDRAWWQVDLGSVEMVSRVALFNRSSCCQQRLQDYDVILSTTPFPAAPVDPEDEDYVSFHEEDTFKMVKVIYAGVPAQYVRVQLRSNAEYLHLAEVEVYADCGNGQTEAWEDCDGGTCCTAACKFAAAATSCDDGNACTTADSCAGDSQTCAGTTISCDDSNPCTDDSCVPASGCAHANNSNACDDGNPCTVYDACWQGVCTATMARDCNNTDPCTMDFCLGSGCAYLGNICPGSQVCGDGQVDAGEQCDDGNRIANDCCSPTCTFEASGTACFNDLNPCTPEACNGQGVCVPAPTCRTGLSCEAFCGRDDVSCHLSSGVCGCALD